MLSAVCEAPLLSTTDQADDPYRPCHFPFRLTAAGGNWSHSCVYETDQEGRGYAWCPTQLDTDGVLVPGRTGRCEDERDTTWAGPAADTPCQLPFFLEGVWYENCTAPSPGHATRPRPGRARKPAARLQCMQWITMTLAPLHFDT